MVELDPDDVPFKSFFRRPCLIQVYWTFDVEPDQPARSHVVKGVFKIDTTLPIVFPTKLKSRRLLNAVQCVFSFIRRQWEIGECLCHFQTTLSIKPAQC
jgi:hypothetical protein